MNTALSALLKVKSGVGFRPSIKWEIYQLLCKLSIYGRTPPFQTSHHKCPHKIPSIKPFSGKNIGLSKW